MKRVSNFLKRKDFIAVMKKHGSNTENISHADLRLGIKLWWLRAPLTFLQVTSGLKPQILQPESSALTTRPLRIAHKPESLCLHLIALLTPLVSISSDSSLSDQDKTKDAAVLEAVRGSDVKTSKDTQRW